MARPCRRLFFPGLLCVLLAACSSAPVNAPVGSRSHDVPGGTRSERSAPATVTTYPAKRTATPRPQAAPAATRVPAADTYVVRRGDTLYSIAWQHGLGVGELAGMNGIRKPYTIYSGQRLAVKPGSRPATAARTPPAPAKPVAKPTPKSAPQPASKTAAAKPAAEPVLPAKVRQWVWPVKGPVIQGYQAGDTGKRGIDIGGKTGQPVKAAAAGKVVYSGSGLVGYGRLIIIKHNETLLSAYGHNSKLLVAEGDYVKAGQVIANMGRSGTDRTRLYFEIRKNGKPVNPLRYLPRV